MSYEPAILPTDGISYSPSFDVHQINLGVGESVNVLFSTSYAKITRHENNRYTLKLGDRTDKPKSFRSTCGSGPAHDLKLAEALGFRVTSIVEQEAFKLYCTQLTEEEVLACLKQTAAFYVNTFTEDTLHPKVPVELGEGEIKPFAHWASLIKPDDHLRPLPEEFIERAKLSLTRAAIEEAQTSAIEQSPPIIPRHKKIIDRAHGLGEFLSDVADGRWQQGMAERMIAQQEEQGSGRSGN